MRIFAQVRATRNINTYCLARDVVLLLISVLVVGVINPIEAVGLDIVVQAESCAAFSSYVVSVLNKSQAINLPRSITSPSPHSAEHPKSLGVGHGIELKKFLFVFSRFDSEASQGVSLFAIRGKRGQLSFYPVDRSDSQIAFRNMRRGPSSIGHDVFNLPLKIILDPLNSVRFDKISLNKFNATNDEFRPESRYHRSSGNFSLYVSDARQNESNDGNQDGGHNRCLIPRIFGDRDWVDRYGTQWICGLIGVSIALGIFGGSRLFVLGLPRRQTSGWICLSLSLVCLLMLIGILIVGCLPWHWMRCWQERKESGYQKQFHVGDDASVIPLCASPIVLSRL